MAKADGATRTHFIFRDGATHPRLRMSVVALEVLPQPRLASAAFIVGAVTMPLVCFLSAWDDRGRYLFFVPVVSLLLATGELLWVSLAR